VTIDIEDVFTGAKKAVTLTHTEVGPDGRPVRKERTLNVRIPKGIRQGQHIRLAKQGNPGLGDGEAGDLLLEVQFKPHPRFRAEGKDIFLDLPVTPWEAALGATVEVETPAGSVDLKIPAGSSGGRKLRLKGRGIPAASPGDLYVILQIALPKADSDAVKDAYKALEKAGEFNPRKQTSTG
jgi:curved DNA-binding protein